MYAIADELLRKEKLSLDLLQPLIEETASKIKNSKPSDVQTGPAVRGDKKTMDAHLKLLGTNKKLKTLYQLISEGIQTKL